MATKRGLVVVPPFVSKDGESMFFPGPGPFPLADLRRYALYWDRLEFPGLQQNLWVNSGSGN